MTVNKANATGPTKPQVAPHDTSLSSQVDHAAASARGPPGLLNPDEAASYLGLSRITMNRYRCQGLGPSYVKFGNRVKYMLDDLDRYIEKHRIHSVA